jgi:hypothetical protein
VFIFISTLLHVCVIASLHTLKVKREVVEKALLFERYQEEQVQLVKEMQIFVKFYKQHIQELRTRVQQLSSMFDTQSDSDEVDSTPGRYSLIYMSDIESRGCIALLNKQIAVCSEQLASASELFRIASGVECDDEFVDTLTDSDNDSSVDDTVSEADEFDVMQIESQSCSDEDDTSELL